MSSIKAMKYPGSPEGSRITETVSPTQTIEPSFLM
jgi:hypothetical protein